MVVASLPFVDSVLGLVFASLVLEVCTLLFTPAKEAAVPSLVPADHLTTANSLSLAAAYGTFPIATVLFALLTKVAEWLGTFELLDFLQFSQESLAFYLNVLCLLVAGGIIATIPISREHLRRTEDEERIDLGQVFTELKEGWAFIFVNPVVRSVAVGLAAGLVGGGMLVPLGAEFAATCSAPASRASASTSPCSASAWPSASSACRSSNAGSTSSRSSARPSCCRASPS